jgi:hypothetical protein
MEMKLFLIIEALLLLPIFIWSCRKVYAQKPDESSTAAKVGVFMAIAIVTTCSTLLVGSFAWGVVRVLQALMSL